MKVLYTTTGGCQATLTLCVRMTWTLLDLDAAATPASNARLNGPDPRASTSRLHPDPRLLRSSRGLRKSPCTFGKPAAGAGGSDQAGTRALQRPPPRPPPAACGTGIRRRRGSCRVQRVACEKWSWHSAPRLSWRSGASSTGPASRAPSTCAWPAPASTRTGAKPHVEEIPAEIIA